MLPANIAMCLCATLKAIVERLGLWAPRAGDGGWGERPHFVDTSESHS